MGAHADDAALDASIAQLLRRLEPIHIRHLDIHENDVIGMALTLLQAFHPGMGVVDMLRPQFFQQAGEDQTT